MATEFKPIRLIKIDPFVQTRKSVNHRNKAWPIIRNNALDIVRKWLGIKSPSGRY